MTILLNFHVLTAKVFLYEFKLTLFEMFESGKLHMMNIQ